MLINLKLLSILNNKRKQKIPKNYISNNHIIIRFLSSNKIDKKPSIKTKPKGFVSQVEMLKITLPILFPTIPTDQIQKDIKYIQHLYNNKGAEYTLRYLKSTAESVEHLVLGQCSRSLRHEKISLGKDRSGWPKWLGKRLKRGCQKDKTFIRYVTTITGARKFITIQTRTNLKSITQPSQMDKDENYKSIIQRIGKCGRKKDHTFIRSLTIGADVTDDRSGRIHSYEVPKLRLSMKSSPNGISFFSFPWDRAAVMAHNGTIEGLTTFMKTYYKGGIEDYLTEKLEPYVSLAQGKEIHVGAISLTHEPGKLKPRVFAILDSLTQTILGPLHDDLMNLLRSIPEDCTFDHNKVATKAKLLKAQHHKEYGFADLSDASDRITKDVYRVSLNDLRDGMGDSWLALLERPFSLKGSVIKSWTKGETPPDQVHYACGQPMGALSSWPAMAYVHHRIVWTAFGSRELARDLYLLLGDDVVFFDLKAYNRYLQLLTKLGISYTNAVSNVGFEFAKRIFVHGQEITGAYSTALWASRRSPELFALEWSNLQTRGYSAGMSFPPAFRAYLQLSKKRYHRCLRLMQVPRGNFTPLELVTWVNTLQGRSNCFLTVTSKKEGEIGDFNHTNQNLPTVARQDGDLNRTIPKATKEGQELRIVEALKAFRQLSTLILKQSFQATLDKAKNSKALNNSNFETMFCRLSGLCKDAHAPIIRIAINEYQSFQEVRIRFLERDLKLMYLNPDDRILLRPSLPDLPRLINFEPRDSFKAQLLFRAQHQTALIDNLSVR